MARVTEDDIVRRLQELPDWHRSENAIVRTLRLASFADAIALVVRIAALAEAADHHPDIDIRFRTIRLTLTTHDEGGLTDRDFSLARQIEQAAAPDRTARA